MANRDIIVIGASKGGLESVSRLLAELPADLPAAVLVVIHISPERPSMLAKILGRSSQMPVCDAEDGQAYERGRVYVAVADRHLLLGQEGLRVGSGPLENRSRPSLDTLFRSAAAFGRSRTIGVILSGLLDDGASGLAMIARCGGVTIVQAPDDALCADMPRSALELSNPDFVLPLSQIGELLQRLVSEPAGPAPPVPNEILMEAALTEKILDPVGHVHDTGTTREIGAQVPIACPSCGGPLWKIGEEQRYRCNVGHSFSVNSLLREQDTVLEQALWAAVRTLEERGRMLTNLSEQSGGSATATRYDSRAADSHFHAQRIRELLLNLAIPAVTPPAA
jgi:two-component system chemotaxis response regulator CheB